jgi:hypothetical protein
MFSLSALQANFTAGALNSSNLKSNLQEFVDGNVTFSSSYLPVMQDLQILFRSRAGIDDLVNLYENEKSIITYMSVSDPENISTGKGVLDYHRTQIGSFFGGNMALWETITKLTFGSDGKITNILVDLMQADMIDLVYPAKY